MIMKRIVIGVGFSINAPGILILLKKILRL
jgi:hypothetical protein